MGRTMTLTMGLMFLIGISQISIAAEHGGTAWGEQGHGGKEHGGTALGEEQQKGKEHGGTALGEKKHGGKEHGGAEVKKTPTKDEIRAAMKKYVLEEAQLTNGFFEFYDPDTDKIRRLSLIRVHERVGKTGDYYYSCSDFRDEDTGELLDLDLDVADNGGELSVVDVRLHKVNGEPSFTYNNNNERIPLKKGTKRHLGMKEIQKQKKRQEWYESMERMSEERDTRQYDDRDN